MFELVSRLVSWPMAWIAFALTATIIVIVLVFRSIANAAIAKAEPAQLPAVLTALARICNLAVWPIRPVGTSQGPDQSDASVAASNEEEL